MPTCHDCEDEECVDGSAISPATVYVAGLNALINWNFNIVVHSGMYSCLYLFQGYNCSIELLISTY